MTILYFFVLSTLEATSLHDEKNKQKQFPESVQYNNVTGNSLIGGNMECGYENFDYFSDADLLKFTTEYNNRYNSDVDQQQINLTEQYNQHLESNIDVSISNNCTSFISGTGPHTIYKSQEINQNTNTTALHQHDEVELDDTSTSTNNYTINGALTIESESSLNLNLNNYEMTNCAEINSINRIYNEICEEANLFEMNRNSEVQSLTNSTFLYEDINCEDLFDFIDTEPITTNEPEREYVTNEINKIIDNQFEPSITFQDGQCYNNEPIQSHSTLSQSQYQQLPDLLIPTYAQGFEAIIHFDFDENLFCSNMHADNEFETASDDSIYTEILENPRRSESKSVDTAETHNKYELNTNDMNDPDNFLMQLDQKLENHCPALIYNEKSQSHSTTLLLWQNDDFYNETDNDATFSNALNIDINYAKESLLYCIQTQHKHLMQLIEDEAKKRKVKLSYINEQNLFNKSKHFISTKIEIMQFKKKSKCNNDLNLTTTSIHSKIITNQDSIELTPYTIQSKVNLNNVQELNNAESIIKNIREFYCSKKSNIQTRCILKYRIMEKIQEFYELPLFLDLLLEPVPDMQNNESTALCNVLRSFLEVNIRYFNETKNEFEPKQIRLKTASFILHLRYHILKYLQLVHYDSMCFVLYSHAMVLLESNGYNNLKQNYVPVVCYFAFFARTDFSMKYNQYIIHTNKKLRLKCLVKPSESMKGITVLEYYNTFIIASILRELLKNFNVYITNCMKSCSIESKEYHKTFFLYIKRNKILLCRNQKSSTKSFIYEIKTKHNTLLECMGCYFKMLKYAKERFN